MMGEKRTSDSLKALGGRLEQLKSGAEPSASKPAVGPPTGGMGMALALSSHMVAGLAVGGGVGYLLDRWLGTGPWLLVVFFFLGAAAGMLNVYRTVTGMDMAAGYRPATGGDRVGKTGATRAKGEQGRKEGGD